MPNYTYHCEACNTSIDAQFTYSERPTHVTCVSCGGQADYQISAPTVMQHAYVDGTKRFTALKEASKLNKQAANEKGQNRKDLEKEIRKMGFKFKKEGL